MSNAIKVLKVTNLYIKIDVYVSQRKLQREDGHVFELAHFRLRLRVLS